VWFCPTSIILEEPVSNWRGHYPGPGGMENGPLGPGGGGFNSPTGPPSMPGTPTYPGPNYGGGNSTPGLVPIGPPSGPVGFVGSPAGTLVLPRPDPWEGWS
ncbi:Hypothetical protein FKW44_010548, partial [Caligus rogercresseyi]